jgi:hypothetical protein
VADETIIFVVPAFTPVLFPGTRAGLPTSLLSKALELVADLGVRIVIELRESCEPPRLGLSLEDLIRCELA